jgi:hypothetical protein
MPYICVSEVTEVREKCKIFLLFAFNFEAVDSNVECVEADEVQTGASIGWFNLAARLAEYDFNCAREQGRVTLVLCDLIERPVSLIMSTVLNSAIDFYKV